MKSKKQTKILLVDDEPLLRLTMSSDLQDAGYNVKTAEDGHQACADLAENFYDMVVTDLIMEGIDGMQVLQEAKRLDPTCGVILITGYGDKGSVIKALRYGADDYLLKPYKREELFFRLARCLEEVNLQRDLKKTELQLRLSHAELEEKVHERTLELQAKHQALSDANTALRVLLEQQGKSKKEIEQTISKNLKDNILPYLDLLKYEVRDKKGIMYTDLIETSIQNITSTFSKELSSDLLNLTPREIQVANLVRQGRTSKDIMKLLSLTLGTVEFYRLNLRKKLGIHKKKINLRSYLLSFSDI
ncbi:MAG: response regulator [Deltaproteobacteria bacterium]|nr:response regulator [Deltaproteobacteria bacterium]